MGLKSHLCYKLLGPNSIKNNDPLVVDAGKTIVIKSIDYTAPHNEQAGCYIRVGTKIVGGSNGDKFVLFPESGQVVNGPATIDLNLDNSQNPNGALLGIGIIYEEN